MSRMTTISFGGNDEDKKRLKLLSDITGKPVGKLVKEAITIVHGNRLANIYEEAAVFFAAHGTPAQQNDSQRTEE